MSEQTALGYAIGLEARGYAAEASELRRLHALNGELLEALKSAERAMSNKRFAAEVLEHDSVVREMIRAAIARAEGKV